MIVRFYRHLKKILQNSEIKAMFPLNFKHITMEYLNYLMIVKPHSFDKIFVKFKKNQTNYEESKVIEKKKSYLG